jgi:hypothetical protein
MKVSFEGMGEKAMTFLNSKVSPAVGGKTVKVAAADTVSACADGDRFAGFCIDADSELATVKARGFVTAAYTGTAPVPGFVNLVSDAAGGVKVSASGGEYLAVEVDTAAKTVGFIM